MTEFNRVTYFAKALVVIILASGVTVGLTYLQLKIKNDNKVHGFEPNFNPDSAPVPSANNGSIPATSGIPACKNLQANGACWDNIINLPFSEVKSLENNRFLKIKEAPQGKTFGTNPYSFVKENAFLEGDDLVLKVNGIPKGSRDIIKSAQVEFKNLDFMYGSYRINAAVPKAEGACFGFFYYFNDTQEIDAELVNSPDYQNQIQFSTHLNSPRHPTGKITAIQKPFINDEKYHEFGFDVYPDGVSFFLNGESTNKFPAPTVAGNIVISYWGNGDKGWSGRPTQTDLVAKVKSLLIYYNNTVPIKI